MIYIFEPSIDSNDSTNLGLLTVGFAAAEVCAMRFFTKSTKRKVSLKKHKPQLVIK